MKKTYLKLLITIFLFQGIFAGIAFAGSATDALAIRSRLNIPKAKVSAVNPIPYGEKRDWLIIYYGVFAGKDSEPSLYDDNESRQFYLRKSIQEIEEAGSSSNIHFVAVLKSLQFPCMEDKPEQEDKSGELKHLCSNDHDGKHPTKMMYLSSETGKFEILAHNNNADMGSSDNFQNYIRWIISRFPAKHIMLILNSHGSISLDKTTRNSIKFDSYGDILRGIKPVDIIFAPGCKTSSWENLNSISGATDYFIGFQTLSMSNFDEIFSLFLDKTKSESSEIPPERMVDFVWKSIEEFAKSTEIGFTASYFDMSSFDEIRSKLESIWELIGESQDFERHFDIDIALFGNLFEYTGISGRYETDVYRLLEFLRDHTFDSTLIERINDLLEFYESSFSKYIIKNPETDKNGNVFWDRSNPTLGTMHGLTMIVPDNVLRHVVCSTSSSYNTRKEYDCFISQALLDSHLAY
jgi:Clostripain family